MNAERTASRTSAGSEVLIVGAGGHARVIAAAARALGLRTRFVAPSAEGVPGAVAEEDLLAGRVSGDFRLILGVGSVGNQDRRRRLLALYAPLGARFVSVVHPAACVAPDATLGVGVFVNQGAQVVTGAKLRDHAIVNTGAVVDHDCEIGVAAHVSPGAVLAGNVRCGAFAHVGAGATVIQGVTIGDGVVVGAGAVVLKDALDHGSLWVGVPARRAR